MSSVIDGWFNGATVRHYFKDGRALCAPHVKRGESEIGEQRYCHTCKTKVLLERRAIAKRRSHD